MGNYNSDCVLCKQETTGTMVCCQKCEAPHCETCWDLAKGVCTYQGCHLNKALVPVLNNRLIARVPDGMVEISEAYLALAENVGFEPGELIRGQLLALCSVKNIRLYRETEVYAWLAEEMKKRGISKPWCWRPLREKDIIEPYHWNFQGVTPLNGYYNCKHWECRSYSQLIPLSLLQKVAVIVLNFGDRVKFFVSDAGGEIKETFIMVRPTTHSDGFEDIIFDLWIQN